MGDDHGPEIKLACSDEMNQYFAELKQKAEHCIELANTARGKGLDPELTSEILMTEDLAARVEGLVGPKGIANRIREAAKTGQTREMLSITIAQELVKQMGKTNKQKAVDQAVRTGLAILTEGVLVAPIEGIAKVEIEKNPDGTEFISLFFAGPIRSAGGTGQAMSVLIADMVRRAIGLDRYKPTTPELERMKEEMSLYHRRQHLQYEPSSIEIETIVSSCPVCVDGEGTEDEEVSGYRNIPRIPTAKIRGGACLVIAEGLCLKAPKLLKIVKHLEIDGWEFIESIANKISKKDKDDVPSKKTKQPVVQESSDMDPGKISQLKEPVKITIEDTNKLNNKSKIKPNEKYMRDSLAGRPVFSNPSQKGGFRLRYGRARTTGLAALAMNPVTMYLLGEFLAIGTQLKIERPGKAGVVTSCDQLEGPIVLMRDQSLVQVNSIEDSLNIKNQIERIIDLGEILIPFGEFVENNHDLVPGAYDSHWWAQELQRAITNKSENPGGQSDETMEEYEKYFDTSTNISFESALEISKKFKIPLHPNFNLFWHDLEPEDIYKLRDFIIENGRFTDDGNSNGNSNGNRAVLELPKNSEIQDILIELCVLHKIEPEKKMIQISYYSLPLITALGLDKDLNPINGNIDGLKTIIDPLSIISTLSGITHKARAPTRIGGSMGRPEKAKERMMKPPVHVLFPIGTFGGPQRLIKTAAEKAKISIEAGLRRCQQCGANTILTFCECGGHTVGRGNNGHGQGHGHGHARGNNLGQNRIPADMFKRDIPIKDMLNSAQKNISEPQLPDIKAVIGLISEYKTPEPIEKGILRAKHGVYVFKDGTVRFDMTDVPLTHFKPSEIGTTIEKLHDLGYFKDHKGEPLTKPNQIVELKPQDLIPSKNCGKYLLKVSKYIDDLLSKFYKMESYYNAATPSDLLGHILLGLSPHTSGAVLGRLIGYTKSNVSYAHPFYHAAKRRNCDGDEDCVMLLLDGLINFSRAYLPGTRGGYMDAPLVFMTYINPNEIDKEAQNIDIVSKYPLEFYQASEQYAKPKDIESIIEMVGNRIGECGQFERFGFMFDTSDINVGPEKTAYTRLESMIEKMEAQLELATQIRAVDASVVAAKVIESHFLPDMIGNLRSFSKQSFRCTKCHAKYRRMPLKGVCIRHKPDGSICGNNLTMTVHKGGVRKYLDVAKKIAKKYKVPKYTWQRIILNEKAIDSTFENDKVKKFTLDEFI